MFCSLSFHSYGSFEIKIFLKTLNFFISALYAGGRRVRSVSGVVWKKNKTKFRIKIPGFGNFSAQYTRRGVWFGEGFIDSYTPYILCQKSMWSFESLFIQNMCWLTIVNNMKINPSIAPKSVRQNLLTNVPYYGVFFERGDGDLRWEHRASVNTSKNDSPFKTLNWN